MSYVVLFAALILAAIPQVMAWLHAREVRLTIEAAMRKRR